MFFRRKGKLRKEFDEKLLTQMEQLKGDHQMNQAMLENSFDPQGELKMSQKLSEAKYFYLFPELKKRQIGLKR